MTNSISTNKSPLLDIVLLIVLVAFASTIIPFALKALSEQVGIRLGSIILSLDVENPSVAYQYGIMTMQIIISVVSFILVPALFIKLHLDIKWTKPFDWMHMDSQSLLLLLGLTFSFMMVNSIFIEWNMNLQFPEPFHSMARQLEDQAEVLTKYLTAFQSVPYFLFAFLTIAIVPALGEEFLFRGIIQKLARDAFGNIHVAIWVTAFLFSAFHFQFFGFVPRMLLGALFGYVFYYSGNLWYAIGAHFINNGLTLVLLYLFQSDIIQYDIENTESVPLHTVGIFLIIGVVLFWYFIRHFQNRSITQDE